MQPVTVLANTGACHGALQNAGGPGEPGGFCGSRNTLVRGSGLLQWDKEKVYR